MVEEVRSTAGILTDFVVFLGASLVCVLVFRRLGLGAVLGYLIAGILIGPQGFSLISGAEDKLHIAEIGIILLLFLVGLELRPSRLWHLKHDIFIFGGFQVALSGVALVVFLMFSTRFTYEAALALALPLALSSTAQVLPMLQSSGRLNSSLGERAFSVLLFQDLAIIPLITIISALSRAPADPLAPTGLQLVIYSLLAISGLVLTGRFILNPLFRLIGKLGEREMFIVAGLFTVLASAAVMQALELSTALGAFVAGLMLADSPYRHELEADIDPFRSLLLGLFFVAVGMMLDISVILERPGFVIGMAAGLIVIKTSVLYLLARFVGMASGSALALGLLLSQGGEFGFVLFTHAENALLILPEASSVFGAVITLSMAMTPLLMILARRVSRENPPKTDHLEVPDGQYSAVVNTAIIVGHGRFGQTVAQMLMAKGINVVLIDRKPKQIEVSQTFNMKVYYGDGTRVDLLRHAGAEQARVICFCIDGDELDAKTLEPVLLAFPQAAILARAFDRKHLIRLSGLDLKGMVREVFESAVQMGCLGLKALGLEDQDIEQVQKEFRERDSESLHLQCKSGDMKAARHLIFHHKQDSEE